MKDYKAERRQRLSNEADVKQGGYKSVTGAKGVRLKHFEHVMARLLREVSPRYQQLPDWTRPEEGQPYYHALPLAARVFGKLPGQLEKLGRAVKKEQQVQSLLRCVFALLPPELKLRSSKNIKNEHMDKDPFTVVDFGGGSGHLAIPLALLVPAARVVVVDIGSKSLELLHSKADHCSSVPFVEKDAKCPQHLRSCDRIPNLFSFHGSVQDFGKVHDGRIDMALALHLCGEGTDVALRLAASRGSSTLIVAPCCVGKTSMRAHNPYVWQSTGSNLPSLTYPQSEVFCQWIKTDADWAALAKAADYGQMEECRTARNAARRTAKALLETDRRIYLESNFGYKTLLTRMNPWEATPKNDILIAWKASKGEERQSATLLNMPDDADCIADIKLTIDYLENPVEANGEPSDANDWTREEEKVIQDTLTKAFGSDTGSATVDVFKFPQRMGGRKRKLIHFVAERMGLSHWGVGESSERTVAVSRARR